MGGKDPGTRAIPAASQQLESGVELGHEPVPFEMGCGHPKWRLNRYTKSPFLRQDLTLDWRECQACDVLSSKWERST